MSHICENRSERRRQTWPLVSYSWLLWRPLASWIIRPRIGMTVSINRSARAASTEARAAIPRDDMARLMERWARAALDAGRRGSGSARETVSVSTETGRQEGYRAGLRTVPRASPSSPATVQRGSQQARRRRRPPCAADCSSCARDARIRSEPRRSSASNLISIVRHEDEQRCPQRSARRSPQNDSALGRTRRRRLPCALTRRIRIAHERQHQRVPCGTV